MNNLAATNKTLSYPYIKQANRITEWWFKVSVTVEAWV